MCLVFWGVKLNRLHRLSRPSGLETDVLAMGGSLSGAAADIIAVPQSVSASVQNSGWLYQDPPRGAQWKPIGSVG